MIEAVVMLRNVAGIMFWAFVDLILGTCWLSVIGMLIVTIIKGFRTDD